VAVDPLSDVLRAVRFRGAVFLDVEGSSPWVAEAPPAAALLPHVMPDADHLMEFHAVLRGACWAARTGEPAVRLEEGDVVVFAQGDAHVMSSAPGLRATSADAAALPSWRGQRLPVPLLADATGVVRPRERSEGRDATRLACGFLGCDARPYNPLLSALPRVLTVRGGARSPWVASLLQSATEESRGGAPGGDAVLEWMSEVVFVEAVRRFVDSMPAEETGWLAGLRDALVGRALTALHAAPADPWTLERLTDALATSRTTLHERFVRFVGLPPMRYLASWRMQLASRRLRDTSAKVLAVALDAGYESEAAFVRAFRRLVGTTPGAWRDGGSVASTDATRGPARPARRAASPRRRRGARRA